VEKAAMTISSIEPDGAAPPTRYPIRPAARDNASCFAFRKIDGEKIPCRIAANQLDKPLNLLEYGWRPSGNTVDD
jgi:hypothetical protein